MHSAWRMRTLVVATQETAVRGQTLNYPHSLCRRLNTLFRRLAWWRMLIAPWPRPSRCSKGLRMWAREHSAHRSVWRGALPRPPQRGVLARPALLHLQLPHHLSTERDALPHPTPARLHHLYTVHAMPAKKRLKRTLHQCRLSRWWRQLNLPWPLLLRGAPRSRRRAIHGQPRMVHTHSQKSFI